jgi:hypothetical protein
MSNDNATQSALQQLIENDAVGQLRRRDGLMAALGSEGSALKLDWVEGVARLLADPAQLEEVEAEARDIWQRGIRHMIWAGMGGSVIAVRVLCDLGFCGGDDDNSSSQQVRARATTSSRATTRVAPTMDGGDDDPSSSQQGRESVVIYPLDSTDPAALNEIVRKIARAKNLALPTLAASQVSNAARADVQAAGTEKEEASNPTFLRALLHDVMMVGVAMGMTSEEPITHLEWFTDLLKQAGLRPAEHLLVMTLPGSYLDRFAHEQQAPCLPLQPDGGTGTGGRMSAPTTRVFLLPAALYLTTHFPGQSGQLRSVLQHAWDEYNLDLATSHPAEHPYVQLAAALSASSRDGACRLLLRMPEGWQAFVSWLEQLMEESLGKEGKGIVVFDDQTLNQEAPGYLQSGMLHVRVETYVGTRFIASQVGEDQLFILSQPSLASKEPHDRLAALAAGFLGWQLSMALYGYLQRITFAGQPAVENYKARARALRTQHDPLQVVSNWSPALQEGILILLAPRGALDQDAEGDIDAQRRNTAASAFARALQKAAATDDTHRYPQGVSLSYLDVTVNGEAQTSLLAVLDEHVHTIGNELVGIPVKLRKAPADYHSTEQSEMDGPPSLVSLRLVARLSEASLLGSYANTFLHAQAVSTWQAMMEAGRPCFLVVIDGALDDAIKPLSTFFSQVEEYLHMA